MARRRDDSGILEIPRELPLTAEREVLAPRAFRRMIAVERKRCERSEQALLLVLIEVGTFTDRGKVGERVVDRILAVMPQITRDTDVIGWYEEGDVVGLIFTGIDRGSRNAALSTILKRVNSTLAEQLTSGLASQISISIYLFPDEWDERNIGSARHSILYPDVNSRKQDRPALLCVKRAMDIVGSSLALFLCAPWFAIIAVAIGMTSNGPILFRQRRVGRHGREFTLYKFRSMNEDNDPTHHREYVRELIAGSGEKVSANGECVYKLVNDSRITPIGQFLRKTSLDELPQFLNVLKGDMSLVGPRPSIPYEVAAYKTWHRRRILQVKPGMTGLWQVTGRSRVGFDEMVRLDLRYAEFWSLWVDLKILMRTPAAVVKGAY